MQGFKCIFVDEDHYTDETFMFSEPLVETLQCLYDNDFMYKHQLEDYEIPSCLQMCDLMTLIYYFVCEAKKVTALSSLKTWGANMESLLNLNRGYVPRISKQEGNIYIDNASHELVDTIIFFAYLYCKQISFEDEYKKAAEILYKVLKQRYFFKGDFESNHHLMKCKNVFFKMLDGNTRKYYKEKYSHKENNPTTAPTTSFSTDAYDKLQKEYDELKARYEEVLDELKYYKENLDKITIEGLSKVRLELVYRLIEKATGKELVTEEHTNKNGKTRRINDGRKTGAAIVARFVTGLAESTCKNHPSNRLKKLPDLSDEDKQSIDKVNGGIKKLELDITL